MNVDAGGTLHSHAFSPVPAVSGDGRFVAWKDFATPRLLVKDMANVFPSVFALDRGSGAVERIAPGTAIDPIQPVLGMSADGSTVAYTSAATDLVGGIAAGESRQVFVRATFGGRTTQLTACGAEAGNATSGDPSLSGDGQIAAFWSVADNLLGTPGSCTLDTNGKIDVFVAR